MQRNETTMRLFQRINELRKQQQNSTDLHQVLELQIRIDNLKNIICITGS